jgi:hypothetical protein
MLHLKRTFALQSQPKRSLELRESVTTKPDILRESVATRRELVLLLRDLTIRGWLMAAAVVAILISIKFFG